MVAIQSEFISKESCTLLKTSVIMSNLLQMPFKMFSYSFPSYSRERYDWSHSINMEMKTVISDLSPVYSGCLKEGKTARSSTNGAELTCFVPHIHKPFLLMKSKTKA